MLNSAILESVQNKDYTAFKKLVSAHLTAKGAALVEAYAPVVTQKVIAEADTIAKYMGGEFDFADGSSHELNPTAVRDIVRNLPENADARMAMLEFASESKDNFDLVAESVEEENAAHDALHAKLKADHPAEWQAGHDSAQKKESLFPMKGKHPAFVSGYMQHVNDNPEHHFGESTEHNFEALEENTYASQRKAVYAPVLKRYIAR